MKTCYLVISRDEHDYIFGIFDNLDDAKSCVVNFILHEYGNEPQIEFWENKECIKKIEHDKGKWSELK